jgi:5-bromo-4-chloroindolyl phosphate hydrolysis protein
MQYLLTDREYRIFVEGHVKREKEMQEAITKLLDQRTEIKTLKKENEELKTTNKVLLKLLEQCEADNGN